VYAGGDLIVRQGERIEGLYVLRRGAASVERDEGVPLARLDEGEVFGEMTFIETELPSASVRADGPVEIDLIPSEHVISLLVSAPGFATRFYKGLATILSHRVRQASSLASSLWRP